MTILPAGLHLVGHQMHNKTHPKTYVIDIQTQGQTDQTEHRQYNTNPLQPV